MLELGLEYKYREPKDWSGFKNYFTMLVPRWIQFLGALSLACASTTVRAAGCCFWCSWSVKWTANYASLNTSYLKAAITKEEFCNFTMSIRIFLTAQVFWPLSDGGTLLCFLLCCSGLFFFLKKTTDLDYSAYWDYCEHSVHLWQCKVATRKL